MYSSPNEVKNAWLRPVSFEAESGCCCSLLFDNFPAERELQRPQCLITAPIRRKIRRCKPTALSKPLLPPHFPPSLAVQQAVLLHPSTVTSSLSNMPHRTYSSPPSQEQKRSFSHIPTRNQPICSPCMPESQRKHALPPFRPFSRSASSQSPMSKSDDEYSSTTRCPSRFSTNEETTTLDKIWGSLFDEDCQPTARLGQLLRGLAMHIVRLGSRGLQS